MQKGQLVLCVIFTSRLRLAHNLASHSKHISLSLKRRVRMGIINVIEWEERPVGEYCSRLIAYGAVVKMMVIYN